MAGQCALLGFGFQGNFLAGENSGEWREGGDYRRIAIAIRCPLLFYDQVTISN
jgi:hypothetical protein